MAGIARLVNSASGMKKEVGWDVVPSEPAPQIDGRRALKRILRSSGRRSRGADCMPQTDPSAVGLTMLLGADSHSVF